MLLQRAWRRSSVLSKAESLRAHYSSHNRMRLRDALRGHTAAAPLHEFTNSIEPAPTCVLHPIALNNVAAATALLVQEHNNSSARDTRNNIGLALRQALDTDTSLLPSLMFQAVSVHATLPSDVFEALVAHCRDHSLSKLATSLAHAIHNDLAPLPSSPHDFITMLVDCGANRAAVTVYEKLQESHVVHLLPTQAISMLSCLQCVYDGVTPRTKLEDIQTDAASIVRYFHYGHKNMAKEVLDLLKRHDHVTPPASLVHQLAVDLKTVGADITPLLEYAVFDRQLVLEPHVYLTWLQTAPMDAAAPMLLKALPSILLNCIYGDESNEIVRAATRQCFRQTRLSLAMEFFKAASQIAAPPLDKDDSERLQPQQVEVICQADVGLQWVITALQSFRAEEGASARVEALPSHSGKELAIVSLYLHPRVSPEVAAEIARLAPVRFTKNSPLGDLLVKSGLYRKLTRALCFDGQVELATSLFAWLQDIQNAVVPLDIWTLFFGKARRLITDISDETNHRQRLQSALHQFINQLARHAYAGEDVDEAVVAAMKAALHVGDVASAVQLQNTSSWVPKDGTQDALATVLAAVRVIADPLIQRSVSIYFLARKAPGEDTDTWPSTSSIFDVLVKNGIHMGLGTYRKMLLQVIHDLDMVTAHAMLQHAQNHSIEVSPDVFTVCFAQHAHSKRDPAAFVSLLNSMSTLGLLQDNGVVYQAAIRACIAAKKSKLMWGCVNRAESRGVMLDREMLGELEALL
ncbi:hypothetical protein H310_05264 [Aphanomyces invadans]|uniref:Uncharacterized protein n=1 Tax=Aphanomyces invadans TaxID=157072 RepID=A0A024U967_9STRA|nr:hypothetical protein H310_05264 [Aphanomyces invadans]ETW02770.1 hypothetical protein H310_05264 [Aphanomyces invadans]|eukprot:XP_008868154.1 hypothetical protein H310_05264 [Aphanomyces invadans]